jgi:peptide/nickel transport system permease protein
MRGQAEPNGTPGAATADSAGRRARLADRESRAARLLGRIGRSKLALVSAIFLVLVGGSAVCSPLVARYDPEEIDLANRLRGPSLGHWLGTDESGRDYFARLVYGGRVSLMVGSVAMTIAVGLGTLGGALAAYFGGWLDAVLMRVADGMLAIPLFFFVLIALAVFGPTIANIVLAIGLTSWMAVARVVRGDVLRTLPLEYVTAARALGTSMPRLLFRHILPQAVPSIVVATTLGVAQAILVESALSYLGLGVQAPQASWGNMLSNAQSLIFKAPQLAFYPGMMILLTVLAFNSLGDVLRDALSPV